MTSNFLQVYFQIYTFTCLKLTELLLHLCKERTINVYNDAVLIAVLLPIINSLISLCQSGVLSHTVFYVTDPSFHVFKIDSV